MAATKINTTPFKPKAIKPLSTKPALIKNAGMQSYLKASKLV